MGSSRFPGKPLALINDRTMLERVVSNALESTLAADVVVAGCDAEIQDLCSEIGVRYVETSTRHTRATARIAEAREKLLKLEGTELASVMLQGDEPLILGSHLDQLIARGQEMQFDCVVNLGADFKRVEEQDDVNAIKMVLSTSERVLYMSRLPIPGRGRLSPDILQRQVCAMFFCGDSLQKFLDTPESGLEKVESIDFLRFIEIGIPIHIERVHGDFHPIDVPSDIYKVEKILDESRA